MDARRPWRVEYRALGPAAVRRHGGRRPLPRPARRCHRRRRGAAHRGRGAAARARACAGAVARRSRRAPGGLARDRLGSGPRGRAARRRGAPRARSRAVRRRAAPLRRPTAAPTSSAAAQARSLRLLALGELLDEPALLDAGDVGRRGAGRRSPRSRGTAGRGRFPGTASRTTSAGSRTVRPGIGWALLELYAATGDARFRDGAGGAFAYERSWLRGRERGLAGSARPRAAPGQRRTRGRRTPPAPGATARPGSRSRCSGERRDAAIALDITQPPPRRI